MILPFSSSTISSGATLQVTGGALTVPSGGTLVVTSGGQLTLTGGTIDGGGTISNSGLVQMNGTTATISDALNNLSTGSVNVAAGTLSLSGGGSGDAPFTIGSGATLDFPAGSYSMTANGTVSG